MDIEENVQEIKEVKKPVILDPKKVYIRDFIVLKELGKGGFGSVFLVRVTEDVRAKISMQGSHVPEIVAMKKIYMGQSISQVKMQSVNKEAQIIRKL